MAVLRTDIERALDEIISNEEGMRFQGLAVVLGKRHWPQLIACERKKDLGLDAYAAASLTSERVGKGLASSITPTLKKLMSDAQLARGHFADLRSFLFVTPAKVGNTDKRRWAEELQKEHNLELHILSREDIIAELMKPENAPLCSSFLNLYVAHEPALVDLVRKTTRAATDVAVGWIAKTRGHSLLELDAVRLDEHGNQSTEVFSIESIDKALSQSQRLILEAPAGRGKTTMLVQLAQRAHASQIAFMVDLPAWVARGVDILDYLAGMPSVRAQGLTAGDLGRVQTQASFVFLLNGWNEIAHSNSAQAHYALRDLEHLFPAAGIIVATRTHQLTPPLPGATRLRLLRLRRQQRTAYLSARLGAKAGELRQLVDADAVLDELTRTPFILAEVVSLFESGVPIPATKVEILAAVVRLLEEGEHQNALQGAPLFGRHEDYLRSLAMEMTSRGAVTLSDTDARSVVLVVKDDLVARRQLDDVPQQPAEVLGALAAYHLIERLDHPDKAFRFQHQQFQEYYAALGVRSLLLRLRDGDGPALHDFMAHYVNQPEWGEALRMTSEALASATADAESAERNRAGRQLVEMALAVDPLFAGELSQLCGTAIWGVVGGTVGTRLRSLYGVAKDGFRQYALAAILATGSEDFKDVIVPLLSTADVDVRLRTYRLWPDIRVSSLGSNWREEVSGWSDAARSDFVAELLRHGLAPEVVDYAVGDHSAAVKKAAVSSLLWTRSHDAATRMLDSLDAQTFEEIAREDVDWMPPAYRSKATAALRGFLKRASDQSVRLPTALYLIERGETGLDDVVKDALAALRRPNGRNLGSHDIRPALEYLRKADSAWLSEWLALQIAGGAFSEYEHWMALADLVPHALIEQLLHRLATEDLGTLYSPIVAVLAARADTNLLARVFSRLRELRLKVEADPAVSHAPEWSLITQLAALFRTLPGDIAVASVLSSITDRAEPIDINVVTYLLNGRSDSGPSEVTDGALKARLRAYLKARVHVVLGQNDFDGTEKANLASALAQVGRPEDMEDLLKLIRADIERVRRGRAARAAGDRSPLADGGSMSYARWNIDAVLRLDDARAEQVLIDLIAEPEYVAAAAQAMALAFLPKPESAFDRTLRYDLIWAARFGQWAVPTDNQRRLRYAAALRAALSRLGEEHQQGKPAADLRELAKALAAIDGFSSAGAVLDVIAMQGQWDEHARLDAAELLLMRGVALPTNTAFALVDGVLGRMERWRQDSDRYLLRRSLVLCAFVDDPAKGIAKIRDVIVKVRLWAHEARGLVTALGKSRCEAAVDLLYELASDAQTFDACEDAFFNAFAALDTPRARELLIGFVDPDVRGLALRRGMRHDDTLVARIVELAKREPRVEMRLRELCERDLPELNRHVLSKVMNWSGTPDAIAASVSLIDDNKRSPIPQGIWDLLEGAFIERRPYGAAENLFTEHARASNELRTRLFRMVTGDQKRRRSAYALLGRIEEWRLDHGRPTGEPRHPDFASGQPWPPKEPLV